MLVTLQEFRSSVYNNPNYSDAAILEALDYAERRFYEWTGRARFGYWLEPKRATIRLDGTGTRLLRSPYPILTLVSCKILTVEGMMTVEGVRVRRHILWYRDRFPEGFANVEIDAYFGDPNYAQWDATVPRDVKEAILRLADLKLRRKRIAGEEVTERRPESSPPPPPTITGDREVDGIIRTYTLAAPLGMLDLRGPLTPDEEELEV